MPRVAVTIEKIKDDKPRKACYEKRKHGLLKKTIELSILTGCDITLVIFDEGGTLDIAYSSKPVDKMHEEFMDQLRLSEDLKVLDNGDYNNLKNKTNRKRKVPKKDSKLKSTAKNTNKKTKKDEKLENTSTVETKNHIDSNVLNEDRKISVEGNTFFKNENVVETNKNFANFSIFETNESYNPNSFKNKNEGIKNGIANKISENPLLNRPETMSFMVDNNNSSRIKTGNEISHQKYPSGDLMSNSVIVHGNNPNNINNINNNNNSNNNTPNQIKSPMPLSGGGRKKAQKKKGNVVPPLSLSQEGSGSQSNRSIGMPNNSFSNFNVTQSMVGSGSNTGEKEEWGLKTGTNNSNLTGFQNTSSTNNLNTPFSSILFSFTEAANNNNVINTSNIVNGSFFFIV
eukprot:TRINITY_DN3439_c0_g1_i2.p1 TRINITY_DN3439_c0_g1~~TRINITY_DN3439_c0_g1_i2.p1  ORF type:complete len:400 (-),score=111.62 TRINITY_DN3439_c0_g1_i2:460-1659(-)